MAVQISRSLLAASAWSANRLDVVAIGAENSLYHTSWNGESWQPSWNRLGENFHNVDPSMISRSPGHLDVFGLHVGSQSVIQTSWEEPAGWGQDEWFVLGGEFRSPVSITSWSQERLDIFSVGEGNQHLWHQSWNGNNWQNVWDDLGGLAQYSIATASWGQHRLDVFALGLDKAVWHVGYGDSYGNGPNWQSEFESLGGFFKSDPVVVAPEEGVLNFFAIGTDDAMYHGYWARSSWSEEWENLQGEFVSRPAVVSRKPGIIELFVIGTDYSVWHNVLEGNWRGWNSLGGGPFRSVPVVVARDEDSIDVFAVADPDGSVWHSRRAGEDWGDGWHSLGIPMSTVAESSPPSNTTSELGSSSSDDHHETASESPDTEPITINVSMGEMATGGTRGMPTESLTGSVSMPTLVSEEDAGSFTVKQYAVISKLIAVVCLHVICGLMS